MMNFLKSLLNTPQFSTGARVNLVDRMYRAAVTAADNIDGRVITQSEKGVLVEWPRGGARWMQPEVLCRQA